MTGASWVLGIDIGTTFCVAAARSAGERGEVIEIAGQRRVPSVVYLDEDGNVVVGQAAENLAAANPGRALRAPKSRLGDPSPIVVGGRLHDSTDLVAALLRHLYQGALVQRGGPPAQVRLTHPAIWGRPRVEQLRVAAERAGLDSPTLLAEPVAAAVAYAEETEMSLDGHVAVYDLGGGTFDTAVLQATAGGFVVVGRPVGEDRLGGELFDELLANHVGAQLDADAWEALQLSDDVRWQQAAAALRTEARRVKEALSSHPYAELMVGLPTGMVQRRVTRDELEALMRPHVEQSVDRLLQVVADAGLAPHQLQAICVTGGASHAPLVEAAIRQAFPAVAIGRRGDPKTTVALGATSPAALGTLARQPPSPTATAATPGPAAPTAPSAPAAGPAIAAMPADPTIPPAAAGPAPVTTVPSAEAPTPLSVPARRKPNRTVWYVAAALLATVAIVAAVLATRPSDGDGDGKIAAADGATTVAGGSDTAVRAARDNTTTTLALTTTSAAAVLTLDSTTERFLGSELRRRWTLSPDQRSLSVSVTVTNVAGGTFRWHHDEPVPKAVAADASAVQSSPAAEVLQADPLLRWWHELAPGQSATFTYTVARQPSWGPATAPVDLAAWEAQRAAAAALRQNEILTANGLTDRLAAPVPVTVTPAAAGPASPGATAAPVTAAPVATAVPAPTVSIVGSGQLCAGQRSYLEGVATGAVRGSWSIPAFNVVDAGWSPTAPAQYLEPNAGAIGGTYSAGLQVVNTAGVSAAAVFEFTVVDCTPAPTVRIDGPATVCPNQNSFFTGVATDATSGSWSLAAFNVNDARWTPAAPSQFVNPNAGAIGFTFTWSLTVVGPTGKTAGAEKSFTVVAC